jgi:histidinol-phosphate aminotransferase
MTTAMNFDLKNIVRKNIWNEIPHLVHAGEFDLYGNTGLVALTSLDANENSSVQEFSSRVQKTNAELL